jgi:hypothetical protein
MTRRLVAALAAVAIVLVACGPPAAPALTDPKEILSKSVLSLTSVKTIEANGTLSGSISLLGRGSIPLDGTTFSTAVDVAGQKVRFALDAPSFLGTKIDALVVDQTAYHRIQGGLALFAGGETGGKFTKTKLGSVTDGSSPSPSPDILKWVEELKAALDKLPSPPTKQADERCGDTDCYHVTLSLTSEQLESLGASAPPGVDGSVTVDVWSRKNDLRPAKITMAAASVEQGNVTTTLEFRYDGAVTIEAPPDDQIVTP